MSRTGERLGPWWFERQLDPHSPDFQVGQPERNVTHRDWLQVGTIGSGAIAVVDPRGAVAPGDGLWSLDWWIGAEDRWHLPAREAIVRQRRIEHAPVVETVLRVPGGEAVHRCYAVQARSGPAVAVEVENRSPVPFALALVITPFGPGETGSIHTITARTAESRPRTQPASQGVGSRTPPTQVGVRDAWVVEVDGRVGVVLPRRASRVAGGCRGAALSTVLAGDAVAPSDPHTVTCDGGSAELALVFPAAHATGVRVLLPADPARSDDVRDDPNRLPVATAVAKGWAAQAARAPVIDLPDDRLAAAFEAARRDLLLLVDHEDVLAWPRLAVPWTTTARVVEAFDLLGFHDEAAQVLRGVPGVQRLSGEVESVGEAVASTGAALRAAGRHWQLTWDRGLIEDLVGVVAKAGHWIEKRRTARRRSLLQTAGYAGASWCIAGLEAVVPALRAVDQREVADDLARFASGLRADVERSLRDDAARSGEAVPPVAPSRPASVASTANLVAAWLDVWDTDHPGLVALVERARDRWVVDGLVVDDAGWGLSPARTLELAHAVLVCGLPNAGEHLHAVLDAASPVQTWPEVLHPRSGGGSRGHGHDPLAVATYCAFVRRMLVDERPGRLDLCRLVPPTWYGQSWEVRAVPSAAGTVGFAVRWHGERPALLWELTPFAPDAQVTITAPGLDPSWSTTEPSGEVLLAPVPAPERIGGDGGGEAEASSSFA